MREKFLIVDDIIENRILLHDLLESDFDVDIDEAEDGFVALELAAQKKYDIVLMDVKMPKKNGYEVAKELREFPLNRNAIIIFITAHDSHATESYKAYEAGGIDYITKPIDHHELIRKLQLYLRFIRKENDFVGRLLEINKRLEHEVSIRKSVEVQLIKAQENFKNIVEKSNAAILIIDDEGILRFINTTGEAIFRRKAKELLGEPIGIIADYESKNEIDIIKGNGEIGVGEITTTKTQWENKPAWLVLINDITEHKELEDKLTRAKEKAQESDRLKSTFLSNMSHEIRTPMTAILGFLDFIEAEEDPERRKEYTDIIRTSGSHLLNLINDIIDISKIEAGQLRIKMADCHIDKLFLELYEFFSTNIKIIAEKVSLEMDIPVNQKELIVRTDKSRLNQVLINLIGNALKFTDTGYIRFGYRRNAKALEFFVEDTGIGIPRDRLDMVFERFKQVEATKTSINSGTGLGLAISKSIVELLGGEIWLKSIFGAGSTFYFTIPLEEIQTGPGQELLDESLDSNPITDFTNKMALIAEDIEINYKILDGILKKKGIQTVWAKNGKEAVELCRNSKFDLVLMDIRMPQMDGLEATSLIRKFNKTLPIIAQTAYALENEKDKCFEVGCNDYISKPINSKQLLNLINKYLAKKYAY